MMGKYLLALALCLFNLSVLAQVFDVPHADEASTRTLLVSTSNPRALVVLFPGGGGMVGIFDNGSVRSRHTFVRSMSLWAQYDIDAVLVDTPYDLGDLRRGNLRGREDHLTRVNEVIKFYQNKLHLPIWIFGHSMGTSTVTNYLNFSSSLVAQVKGGIIAGTIQTAMLNDEVSVPILAIHHKDDACSGTPVSASESIIFNRPKKFISQLDIVDGGISQGNVCDSFAYHGFNQTEPELVKRAAQFILSH